MVGPGVTDQVWNPCLWFGATKQIHMPRVCVLACVCVCAGLCVFDGKVVAFLLPQAVLRFSWMSLFDIFFMLAVLVRVQNW